MIFGRGFLQNPWWGILYLEQWYGNIGGEDEIWKYHRVCIYC